MLLLLADAALGALLIAGSADLVTTEVGLRRGGYVEANPLMSRPEFRITVKAASTAAVIGVSRHLEKKGRRKAARIVLWTGAAVWAGAAGWNAYQLRRRR